jgi:capsule polysaccharide export protein KpsE/RkpR
MKPQDNNTDYMSGNKNLLLFSIQNIKILAGIAVVAGVLAVVFSSAAFITPKYESTAVIYPSNVWEYSDETALEQIQQYLASNVIRDSIINKFNLYEEYEVDPADIHAKTWVNLGYGEHVSISETQFESIRINVLSVDPVKAKEMVAEIIKQLNMLVIRINREKVHEVVVYRKKLVDDKKNQIDSTLSILSKMGAEYNLMEYEAQSERVTEGYLSLLKSGKGGILKEVEELYKNVAEKGPYFSSLLTALSLQVKEYDERLVDYEISVSDYNKEVTYSNLIVEPEVNMKKAYPVRWLIVALSMIGSVVFGVTVLILSRVNFKG